MDYQLEILLSTYNGEQFLNEQIDSLLSQTFKNWRLLIRDDGSTDATKDIIDIYVKKHVDKIILLEDNLGNLGASLSYSQLLGQSSAKYVALCDQDDVWDIAKLAIQMDQISKEESALGSYYPLLINTDLQVADQSLNILSSSFWEYQNLNPLGKADLCHLLVQNHMTGCTFLMNRALVNKALPISENAIMHDWWLAILAATQGKIVSLDAKTVLYRQHGENEIGANEWRFTNIIKDIFSGKLKCKESLNKTKLQASALFDSGLVSKENKMIIKKYMDLFDMGWLERRKTLIREKFYKQGFLRNFAMFLYL